MLIETPLVPMERNALPDFCIVGSRPDTTEPGALIVQCPNKHFGHCCICKRTMCADHSLRDIKRNVIDICTECGCDAAVILAKSGKDPRTTRITRDGLQVLANAPTWMIPKGLTFEQLERFERDLFNDPTVLGKWKPRCKGRQEIVDLFGPGQSGFVACAGEDGHTLEGKPHRSEGGREWTEN